MQGSTRFALTHCIIQRFMLQGSMMGLSEPPYRSNVIRTSKKKQSEGTHTTAVDGRGAHLCQIDPEAFERKNLSTEDAGPM